MEISDEQYLKNYWEMCYSSDFFNLSYSNVLTTYIEYGFNSAFKLISMEYKKSHDTEKSYKLQKDLL